MKEQIHQALIAKQEKIESWVQGKRSNNKFPIYTSVDIRDSGFKVTSVDANIYPAGFNNICQVDKDNAGPVFNEYLNEFYSDKVSKVLLITEEHTSNAYYWENVCSLAEMILATGRELRLAMPKSIDTINVETASGKKLQVYGAERKGESIELADGFQPDLIISNNDFSSAYEDWSRDLQTPINPFRQLGWYQRKKNEHFEHYNHLACEFSELIGIDPWWLKIESELFSNFSITSEESKQALAKKVDTMLANIAADYSKREISTKPQVFIKNNSGTYGLAVTKVESGQEVIKWNNRTRTKMKAAKGGRAVEELLIQEAIPSIVQADGYTAEPVIYLVGNKLLGGFLRAHSKKGPDESLNSPGAVYQRMCVSDLKINPGSCPLENVYGWVAKLSSLAISQEMQALGLT